MEDDIDENIFQAETSWKNAKKKGLSLENQLQIKLDQFTLVVNPKSFDSEKAGVLERELASLFKELKEVEFEMAVLLESPYLTQTSGPSSASLTHTHQRLKAIIQNGEKEFARAQQALRRTELFTRTSHSDKQSSGVELLLRENVGLSRSIDMTDQALAAAADASQALKEQHGTLRGTQSKLGTFAAFLPRIDLTLKSIKYYRIRDNLILALVVASCMCFLVFYWWHKGS